MTVFYAYIQHYPDPNIYRWLITFANQETANEWWRAILKLAKDGRTGYTDIKRIATQMYSYNANTLDLANSIRATLPLAPFADSVFYTLLPNCDHQGYVRISDLPPPPHRDPISGERYFIRTKSVPHLYWWKNPANNQILASEHARSAFRIQRSNESTSGHEGNVSNVMIDEDDIDIIFSFNLGQYVTNGTDNRLTLSGRSGGYKFRNFKNSFATWDDATQGATSWSTVGDQPVDKGCKISVLFTEGAGYGWELV
ncbi:hypothetical protein BJX65DRAFT_309526 [Aspergillus insuetus]